MQLDGEVDEGPAHLVGRGGFVDHVAGDGADATQPPVACTLGADDLRCRADELLPGLVRMARSVNPHASGARLTFDAAAGIVAAIAAVVERERHCCRFLHFVLEVPSGGEPITLDISGPDGTVAFLASLAPELRASG